jgi:hypothetical protein
VRYQVPPGVAPNVDAGMLANSHVCQLRFTEARLDLNLMIGNEIEQGSAGLHVVSNLQTLRFVVIPASGAWTVAFVRFSSA